MNVNTNINKIKRIKRNIGKSGIALFLVAGFGFLLVGDANAQYRRDNRQTHRVERIENRNNSRIAVAQGRSDGLREGANAIRKRNRHNPYGEGKFKKALTATNRVSAIGKPTSNFTGRVFCAATTKPITSIRAASALFAAFGNSDAPARARIKICRNAIL